MTIPFRVKLLTPTAKAPERANDGDLFDLFAESFCDEFLHDHHVNAPSNFEGDIAVYATVIGEQKAINDNQVKDRSVFKLLPRGRILVKTGIALELPIQHQTKYGVGWFFPQDTIMEDPSLLSYAVADIRPRSGLALKHGITVLNTPGTIDNSYRKEIGVILYNAGHEPYTIKRGDKIAQMLIRSLYLSKMEIVENIDDTGRGGYGSTGN